MEKTVSSMWFDHEQSSQQLWEEQESEEEHEDEITSESDWEEDELLRKIPFCRGPSMLPYSLASDEEPTPPAPECLSSSSENGNPPKPRVPPKKFFEDPKFYIQKNEPVIPHREWDEEENFDNIETLMKQTIERNELDGIAMMGGYINLVSNHDDVIYKESPPKPPSADSNEEILSSSSEEDTHKSAKDHYREVVLVDNKIKDCQPKMKVSHTEYPRKCFGSSKIVESEKRMSNQKQTGTKSTQNSCSTSVLLSEGGRYCPAGQTKKCWKLREPFPKRDSIEKNVSSSSIKGGSGSDGNLKMDDSQRGPSKVYPSCKWFEECNFKALLKQAVKREKKISMIQSSLGADLDEILDDLHVISKDAKNRIIPTLINDFIRYDNEFAKKFEVDRVQLKDADVGEIKMWPHVGPDEYIDVGELLESSLKKSKTVAQGVSTRLYEQKPRKDTPRAAVEARLVKERALITKKRKQIVQMKSKPIETNAEALPQAMEAYYKEKKSSKKRKDGKPDDGEKRQLEKKEEDYDNDLALHPSYTKLIPPYTNVCNERIRKTLKQYRTAFNKELASLASQETFALARVTLKRMYMIAIGSGKPPIDFNCKEKARVNKILAK